MSLVHPSKKDPYGLAGRNRAQSPLSPRIRRIKPKPIIPKAAKDAVVNFGLEIWYSKDEAKAKIQARKRKR